MKFGQFVRRVNIENNIINKCTIIIPCFNSHEYLSRAIQSIENQTIKFYEVIIINDGSTNKETIKYLSNLEKDYIIINQQNKGLAAARNQGVKLAKSNWVTFLDCDDWLENDTHEIFINSNNINNNNQNIFYYQDIILEGEKKGIHNSTFNYFEQHFMNGIPYSIFISRKLFLSINGYDESFRMGYEDWEFNLRLLYKSIEAKKLNKATFHYFVSHKGMLNNISKKLHSKIFLDIIQKHQFKYKFKNLFNIFLKSYSIKSQKSFIVLIIYYIIFRILKKNFRFNYFKKY